MYMYVPSINNRNPIYIHLCVSVYRSTIPVTGGVQQHIPQLMHGLHCEALGSGDASKQTCSSLIARDHRL